jgi:sortase A
VPLGPAREVLIAGIVQRPRTATSIWFVVETLSFVVGVGCLVYVAVRYSDGVRASRVALDRFAELRTLERRAGTPELTLWSPQRVAAWQNTLTLPREEPLAVLHVPGVQLQVPVLEGTSDLTLDRGAGHIEDTAMPGAPGNSGIAGHRDGFFRSLKDVKPGDPIQLETLHETQTYRVERTWIVNPDDVSVLDPTPTQSITLVTCYPFYFVGSAPQRYIVRAVRDVAPGP